MATVLPTVVATVLLFNLLIVRGSLIPQPDATAWCTLDTKNFLCSHRYNPVVYPEKGCGPGRSHADDFIVLGVPGSPPCQEVLDAVEYTCTQLRIPLAKQKDSWPDHMPDFFWHQYRKGLDHLEHQMLTVPAITNPQKSLLWDPDPG